MDHIANTCSLEADQDSHLLHSCQPVSPFSTQVREQPSSTHNNKVPLFSLQRLANRFFSQLISKNRAICLCNRWGQECCAALQHCRFLHKKTKLPIQKLKQKNLCIYHRAAKSHQHLTPAIKTQGLLHLNASSGLLWHHLPDLNFLHLPSSAFPLPSNRPHGHCCHRGAAGNSQFRKRMHMPSEGRCPKASQSLLWGWSSSNKSLSTPRWWWKKSSVSSLPEHTDWNVIIATAVVPPKILYLWWWFSPVVATVAWSPCGDCSTGFLKGWCLLPSLVVVRETSFTSIIHGWVHFPVFIKGLHQCCYLGSLPSISRSNLLVWEKPLHCFLSHEQFFSNYVFFSGDQGVGKQLRYE